MNQRLDLRSRGCCRSFQFSKQRRYGIDLADLAFFLDGAGKLADFHGAYIACRAGDHMSLGCARGEITGRDTCADALEPFAGAVEIHPEKLEQVIRVENALERRQFVSLDHRFW